MVQAFYQTLQINATIGNVILRSSLFNSNVGTGIWHGILPGLHDPKFSLSGDRLEGESATRGNFVQQALSETDSLHQVSSIGCSIVRQKRPLAASSGHASYGSPWR